MLERLKQKLAPPVLLATSNLLRARILPPRMAVGLWGMAQRYFLYHDVRRQVRLRNGMIMAVSSAPRVEQEIFLFGEWEPLFTRYLEDKPRTDGTFLDVGSNIGYFSLIAQKKFGQVHAIEASPSVAKRLMQNIQVNNLNNVTMHNFAVGYEAGEIDFYLDTDQSGGSSVFPGPGKELEGRVPMAPLDVILSELDWTRVQFVKIDVEGSEAAVLEALQKRLSELDPKIEIFVEFDPARSETWPQIQRFISEGFEARVVQGLYDRMEYVCPSRRTRLAAVEDEPTAFCDLLLTRP